MSPLAVTAATMALLAGNAFFVVAEFALVTVRRPRLERAAARGSRAARAAAAASAELPLTLAGAQLGVTMCSLGLGAVTEPAVEHFLASPLHAIGAPEATAEAIALAVALALVTLAHMVAGEMAPKSWAITGPERAALAVALPFRAFTLLTRPALAVLNAAATLLVRTAGIRAADDSDLPGPQHLARLLGRSRRLGLLGPAQHDLLTRALAMHHATIAHLITPASRVTTIPPGATSGEVRAAAAASSHTRLLVRAGDGTISGIVHARDAITGTATTAASMAYPVPALAPDTTVLNALTALRAARAQLAVVTTSGEPFSGLISLDDLLSELLTTNPH